MANNNHDVFMLIVVFPSACCHCEYAMDGSDEGTFRGASLGFPSILSEVIALFLFLLAKQYIQQ